MAEVMDELINKYAVHKKASVRGAACAWLLCALKWAGELPSLKAQLPAVQKSCSRLLNDRSEFTQEVASKALGMVYELADGEMRDELVDNLVAGLSRGKMKGNVMTTSGAEAGTEDGDQEILAEAGEGLSTYKDLCSVANDMGQPELIYRFMDLVGHHSIWNSRKGAAFGFTSIAAKAEDRLLPHLPSLVPKLFRYQHDPNQTVAEAMKAMWDSLIKDEKKALDEYFDAIMADLLSNMGSRQWRVRESSTNALGTLLMNRKFDLVENKFEDIWTMTLRVLDDVKETVRKSALTLFRTLNSLSLKVSS